MGLQGASMLLHDAMIFVLILVHRSKNTVWVRDLTCECRNAMIAVHV